MSSFAAYFYQFKKRTNSTERPGESSLLHTLNVTLKSGSSIVNPTLEIAHGATFSNVVNVNYCHIPTFNRYYFVTNTVYERGIWYLTLKVDVMATYKSEIGADTRYILRSSAESDGTLVDMMYPTKCKTTYAMTTKSVWAKTINDGCYVVTTLSDQGYGVGAATYWALTPAQFKTFTTVLFGDTSVSVSNIVINASLVNKLINPAQYITRCVWYPFSVDKITSKTLQEYLFVGSTAVPGVQCYSVDKPGVEFSGTLTLSDKHPQIARGNYVLRSPYTKYQLYMPPFGVVPFDVIGASSASVIYDIYIDLLTAVGKLYYVTGDGETHTLTANVGIDVPLAQLNSEFLSKAGTLSMQIGKTVGSAIGGNVAGVVSGGLSSIGAAWDSWENVSALGSLGGNLQVYGDKLHLHALYMHVADDDNERRGRPLCARRTISKIPGFILCGDGYTRISGTSEEYDQVNQIMKEGFFYA